MPFSRADKEKLLKHIGSRITLHRSIKGYTIEELAIKCDLEYQQLLEIEVGKIDVRILNLLKITNNLDIELSNLLP